MPQGWNTEQVIIEIVPAQGQSPIEAEEWLNNARIGSRPVMELFRRQRSPGAWTGKLSQEIRLRYTQRSQAQLYEVRNLMVGGEDRDQPAIQSEQPLIIWGDNDLQAPEAILLYRPAKSPVGDAA